MENQIAKVNEDCDFKEIAIEYLRGMGLKLPQKYEYQFVDVCKAYGLNPIKREIYAVGYGDKWNVITGYEVYLKRAERTGKLNGWNCTVEGEGENIKAILTIYRKDWQFPFTHEVYYKEAVGRTKEGKPNSMWAKMPKFMLRKVAIAQGFRLAFPDELGGMPYTSDELSEITENEENKVQNITPNYNNNNSNVSNESSESVKENVIAPKKERSNKTVANNCNANTNNNVNVTSEVKPEPKKNTQAESENAKKLRDLLIEYENAVNPMYFEFCKTALESKDEKEIVDKLERLKKYLTTKKIMRVA